VVLMVLSLSSAVAAEAGGAQLDPEAILSSHGDLAAQAVLAQGEPSFETTVALLPELVGYVPVSSASAARKLVVGEQGEIGYLGTDYSRPRIKEPLFDPHEHMADLPVAAVQRELIDGRLPGVQYTFLNVDGKNALQEVVFSLPGEPESTYVSLGSYDRQECFLLTTDAQEVDPSTFDEALAAFRGHWQREMAPAIRVDLPEPRLVDASLAALARTFTTFVGDRPKYGLGSYAQDVHDGFPPTILWMTNACLEWGLFAKAQAYLTYYFERFVRDDGSFNYYGPAVSEYGQMLDLVARYVRYTEDGKWLTDHRAKVEAMAGRLIGLRTESLRQPTDAITRGLLYGSPEADTREETEFHFSGTAWASRGLLELARLYREQGLEGAGQYEREAAALRADLNRAARASLIPGDPPFLPPYPGLKTPFPSMTADTLASYTNYRYWLELLSAGVLDPDLADAVFEYRRRMGGELSATTRFAGQLDDWPLAHYGRALIADDRIDSFLLALYGHLALQQMPGTFCAYEQVAIRGSGTRTYAADYCVPAQLTMPLLVRWMLVYEEPDTETLWLCKAAPKRWFAPGQTIRVRNAPTRWGPVSFEVKSGAERVAAQVIPPPRLEGRLLLRVRRPDGQQPAQVAGGDFDPEVEAVVVEPGASATVGVVYG